MYLLLGFPAQRRVGMGKQRAFKSAALAEVNRHILEAARESISEEQQWEFFCECGRADCSEHVFLTPDAYVALRDGGNAVLAPGHRLGVLARAPVRNNRNA
jgi:hypothetical protein